MMQRCPRARRWMPACHNCRTGSAEAVIPAPHRGGCRTPRFAAIFDGWGGSGRKPETRGAANAKLTALAERPREEEVGILTRRHLTTIWRLVFRSRAGLPESAPCLRGPAFLPMPYIRATWASVRRPDMARKMWVLFGFGHRAGPCPRFAGACWARTLAGLYLGLVMPLSVLSMRPGLDGWPAGRGCEQVTAPLVRCGLPPRWENGVLANWTQTAKAPGRWKNMGRWSSLSR